MDCIYLRGLNWDQFGVYILCKKFGTFEGFQLHFFLGT